MWFTFALFRKFEFFLVPEMRNEPAFFCVCDIFRSVAVAFSDHHIHGSSFYGWEDTINADIRSPFRCASLSYEMCFIRKIYQINDFGPDHIRESQGLRKVN